MVLDLVNTVTARNAEPVDWLDSYGHALEWAALTEHFNQSELARLKRMSTADPGAGVLALDRLRELREAVHGLVGAAIRHEGPAEKPRARFEALWRDAAASARLSFPEGRGRLDLRVQSSRLDYLGHYLALHAFDLLQELPLERTRVCAGSKCGWLFIDHSKGGRRRWCDMATCGNAAKSRRHSERQRATKS